MGQLGVFDKQKMHTQFIGKADFKDVAKREDVRRWRRINIFLWILSILGIILSYSLWNEGLNLKWSIICTVLTAVFILALLYRYGWHRKLRGLQRQRGHGHGGGWEEIDRLPDWAYRKMKRRDKDIVNGDHYRYMRKGNKFYRKRK